LNDLPETGGLAGPARGVERAHASADAEGPEITILVPVHDEAGNIASVIAEIVAALSPVARFEIVCVDDGSTDGTDAALRACLATTPALRVLTHARCAGKSRALGTGARAARAPWIATMDGDGQNDPADIPAMFARALAATGPVLVAGQRPKRQDTWSKRAASRVANAFRRAVLNDACPDTGCGMKLFPRAAFLELPLFEGMHRFLPALFGALGLGLVMHPVADRKRLTGRSKYSNLGRALVGVPDLLTVVWLRRRMRAPGDVTEA
jgi:dolichol-phosphate mannosyltransferase